MREHHWDPVPVTERDPQRPTTLRIAGFTVAVAMLATACTSGDGDGSAKAPGSETEVLGATAEASTTTTGSTTTTRPGGPVSAASALDISAAWDDLVERLRAGDLAGAVNATTAAANAWFLVLHAVSPDEGRQTRVSVSPLEIAGLDPERAWASARLELTIGPEGTDREAVVLTDPVIDLVEGTWRVAAFDIDGNHPEWDPVVAVGSDGSLSVTTLGLLHLDDGTWLLARSSGVNATVEAREAAITDHEGVARPAIKSFDVPGTDGIHLFWFPPTLVPTEAALRLEVDGETHDIELEVST